MYLLHIFYKGPSWSWSYGSWIHNYLCNQCPSPLKLWVRTLFDKTLCDKVCQWRYNWNIVESDVKLHKPTKPHVLSIKKYLPTPTYNFSIINNKMTKFKGKNKKLKSVFIGNRCPCFKQNGNNYIKSKIELGLPDLMNINITYIQIKLIKLLSVI